MTYQVNDWGNPDATKNITLNDADRFNYELAAALGLAFAERYIRTTQNTLIPESELRAWGWQDAPVNLCGKLVGQNAMEVNIATFRNQIRAAAQSSDPIGAMYMLMPSVLPGLDVAAQISRQPAVQGVIRRALQNI